MLVDGNHWLAIGGPVGHDANISSITRDLGRVEGWWCKTECIGYRTGINIRVKYKPYILIWGEDLSIPRATGNQA